LISEDDVEKIEEQMEKGAMNIKNVEN